MYNHYRMRTALRGRKLSIYLYYNLLLVINTKYIRYITAFLFILSIYQFILLRYIFILLEIAIENLTFYAPTFRDFIRAVSYKYPPLKRQSRHIFYINLLNISNYRKPKVYIPMIYISLFLSEANWYCF